MRVVELPQRVGDGKPEMTSRFRWRAQRYADRGNRVRIIPSYRFEVVREDGRWAVVAFQNVAFPSSEGLTATD